MLIYCDNMRFSSCSGAMYMYMAIKNKPILHEEHPSGKENLFEPYLWLEKPSKSSFPEPKMPRDLV